MTSAAVGGPTFSNRQGQFANGKAYLVIAIAKAAGC